MIEAAALAVGWLIGAKFGAPFAWMDGLVALLVFLVAVDELVAALADQGRRIVSGIARKFAFCWLAVAADRAVGFPFGAAAVFALTLSIFVNIVWRPDVFRGRSAW